MNKEELRQKHPNIKNHIEDILWHGFDGSVVVIDGKQQWVDNKNNGITVRKRPSSKY